MDRNRRQRQRSAHSPRGVHLSDEVLIDADACRALLDSRQRIDAASRLMLETAVAHGDGVLTVG
jgi:hypothetical protein